MQCFLCLGQITLLVISTCPRPLYETILKTVSSYGLATTHCPGILDAYLLMEVIFGGLSEEIPHEFSCFVLSYFPTLCCAHKSMFRLIKEHLNFYLLKAQDIPYSWGTEGLMIGCWDLESLMSRCWDLKWACALNIVLVSLWGQSCSGILACWLCSLSSHASVYI